MKISEITLEDVKDFIKTEDNYDDRNIQIIMSAVKSYILGETGLTVEEMDKYEDLTDAYCVLCNEMLLNREYTVQNDKVNVVVKSILDMHCRNLL